MTHCDPLDAPNGETVLELVDLKLGTTPFLLNKYEAMKTYQNAF